MAETKRFKSVLWENPQTKERLRCREITENGSQEIIIDINDKENYEAVLAEFSLDEIDKRTEEDVKRFREEKAVREQEQMEQEQRRFQEDLFTAKLTLFELPEIKQSKNKLLKRRLRKAESFEAMTVYAAAVVADFDNS
jgi:hypothetical protein